MKINWAGFATTKGRQAYAWALVDNYIPVVNYDGGFLIGWDQWSDGRIDFAPDLFRANPYR